MTFDQLWQEETAAHLETAKHSFDGLEADVARWVDTAADTIRQGGKILFCGNGGSAGDAQHLAAELSVRYKDDRAPVAALCLSLDPSAMTACANDLGYDQVFARQIEALGRAGDMVVGLSTSGTSANILQALKTARAAGLKTVGLSGKSGGDMANLCDILIAVPSPVTARIQEMHITLGHIFCAGLERELNLV